MSVFTTPLEVRFVDGKFWILLSPFTYYVDMAGEEVVFVAAGFKTDFASIPHWAWSFIGHPAGRYGKAAVVHDWLYQNPDDGVSDDRSRRRCDQIFLEGMKVLGVGWLTRTVMYTAVRIGGSKPWKEYREDEEG